MGPNDPTGAAAGAELELGSDQVAQCRSLLSGWGYKNESTERPQIGPGRPFKRKRRPIGPLLVPTGLLSPKNGLYVDLSLARVAQIHACVLPRALVPGRVPARELAGERRVRMLECS